MTVTVNTCSLNNIIISHFLQFLLVKKLYSNLNNFLDYFNTVPSLFLEPPYEILKKWTYSEKIVV